MSKSINDHSWFQTFEPPVDPNKLLSINKQHNKFVKNKFTVSSDILVFNIK